MGSTWTFWTETLEHTEIENPPLTKSKVLPERRKCAIKGVSLQLHGH